MIWSTYCWKRLPLCLIFALEIVVESSFYKIFRTWNAQCLTCRLMSRNRNIAGVVDLLNGGIRATMALIKRMWNSHKLTAKDLLPSVMILILWMKLYPTTKPWNCDQVRDIGNIVKTNSGESWCYPMQFASCFIDWLFAIKIRRSFNISNVWPAGPNVLYLLISFYLIRCFFDQLFGQSFSNGNSNALCIATSSWLSAAYSKKIGEAAFSSSLHGLHKS